MMRIVLFLTLSLVIISVQGQRSEIAGGGFGHFFGGGSIGQWPAMTRYLQSPLRLGTSYAPEQAGYTFGGAGYGCIRRIMLGGTAAFHGYGKSVSDSAQVWNSAGSAFFNMGYLLMDKTRWFAFPYAGIGGTGYTVKVRNSARHQSIEFDNNRHLQGGERGEYIIGGVAWDAGFSMKYFIIAESDEGSHGGMLLGLDVGCSGAFMSSTRWQDNNGNRVSGPGGLRGFMPYVRITLGGGGITRK
jgi:hypothetical protein